MNFVHLHNHSDYSILDGAITVDKMIDKASDLGMPGVALTDHGNMFGAIEFYQKAKSRGIKPIIGQEFYVAPKSRFDREAKSSGKENAHHLILLAKNMEGYKNLIKLSSIGYLEGFYYKPRIDFEVLSQHSKGLICSSACIGGEIPILILKGRMDEALQSACAYRDLFGKDNYYLELQDHGIPEQITVNKALLEISGQTGIPLIATNDCHYLNKEDAYSHEVLLCIQTGKYIDDENRMRFPTTEFYFKSAEEMISLFSEVPDAIYNTTRICDMIDLELDLGNAILPHFSVPEGFTLDSYLRHLVIEGAKIRFGSVVPDEVMQRIDYELTVITSMKFSGYFLIVWDFINYAKRENIPVGPGRGSAAGSMVSYCLGITSLNPIAYNLLFERFLNPDRNEMPDMDIDFCAIRREEVIDYVKEKYGKDHVSQIITFNKMKAKAVIKDVARVFRIPFADANIISKHISESSLKEELNTSDDLKKIYNETEKGKMVIDISLTLEGLTRSAGKHAAGVVISREPLTEYAPLYRDTKDGSVSSQFEKNSLEKAGLVKMDFLGLKNLTIIDKCLKLIKKHKGVDIDIDNLTLDDEQTFDLLRAANTKGVFQLESGGMQNILRKLGPTVIEDIIAINALYRPGPLDSGMVDEFITRKRNPSKVKYLHPILEPILKDTLGVIVYQEQVMLIAQHMAKFSLAEADKLRKAMGKKIFEIIKDMEEKFIKGAIENNISEKIAREIFGLIEKFARYGFNKSHSAAYAIISYQTAYLKAHYPVEYMCALLSAMKDPDDITKYVNDCRANAIPILPPDINYSEYDFTIENNTIRFGLNAIKGIGEKAIDSIIHARKEMKSFATLSDFLENIDIFSVNKGAMESLIKAGALDSVHANRAQLCANIDLLLETAKKQQQDKLSGQGSLFDTAEPGDDAYSSPYELSHVRSWHDNEKLQYEKEVLGLYITGHPLARYEQEIQSFSCISIPDLSEQTNNESISIVGIIYNLKVRISKNGKKFAIGMVEDMEGTIEAVFFPATYEKYEHYITMDEPVMLTGKVEIENEAAKKIIVKEVQSLREIRLNSITALHITLDSVGTDTQILSKLKSALMGHSGDCPVYFHVDDSKGNATTILTHHAYNIAPNDVLIKEISHIIGYNAIRYSLKGCS
ncbi:MAG TPA: DNA polymerase III subunit alpha [Spirochaetota bacterium]|nr:DNA polymerase III subunit alpha [Spirochaetota bacterium]